MLRYDHGIFQKFRTLAVTEISELVPGKTYYGSNGEFVFARTLTEKGLHSLPNGTFNILLKETDDDVEPRWILTATGRTFSLTDCNIGASYNPWLIFDDKEIAEDYERQLEVIYHPRRDNYFDYSDYYRDGNYYRDED